jgi:hypothetical protein
MKAHAKVPTNATISPPRASSERAGGVGGGGGVGAGGGCGVVGSGGGGR